MIEPNQDLSVAWPSARKPRFSFRFHDPGLEDYIHDSFLRKGNFYEDDLLRLLASLGLRKGVVLDVGAYVGNHSIFFAGVMGKSVISVEANPGSYGLLCKNIDINGLSEMINPLCLAATSKSGERFWMGGCLKDNRGSMRFTNSLEGIGSDVTAQEEWIEGVALDELGIDDTSLIKVDVEGMELSVLEGLSLTIDKFKPVLAIECMTAIEFAQVAAWCYERGYLPVSRKAATPVLVFAHSSDYSRVCHGCPPPPWSHFLVP